MHRMRHISLLTIIGLIGLVGVVFAQADSRGPVDEAALDTLADFPWYDAEKAELRRIDVKPPADVKNRDSKWLFNPPTWSMPNWLIQLIKVVCWLLLAAVIAGVAYLLIKAFMNLEDGFVDSGGRDEDLLLSGDIDRVDALPFQLKRPRGDLLAEATRLYNEGLFAEAMIYLYSYQLVQLDKSHVIRLTRGKTNRQYMREIRRRSNLHELMQQSMVTFEDVFFGNHPLGRSSFESCWTRLDEFHHQLEPEHAIA